MINNRQAGRRRGRGGQQQRPQGGNSGRGQDTGNRIDNRARGNAAQLLEKYKALARDAQMQGDRVNTEYYLQFADHYFRVLAETRSRFEENNNQPQGRRPGGANTFDEDEQEFEDEGEPIRGEQVRNEQGREQQGRGEQQPRQQHNGQNQNGAPRNNGNVSNGQYDDERPRNRSNGNTNGNGGERSERADRGGERQDRYTENRRPRDDNRQNDRQQDETDNAEIAVEQAEAPAQIVAPVEAPLAEAVSEQPRRRGRPRRVVPVEAEGEPAPTFDAGLLPPSLTAGLAPVAVDEGETAVEEKPRRRRGRPPASETTQA